MEWFPGLVVPAEQLTPVIIEQVKAALTPQETVALTAWAEARSRLYRGRWMENPISALVDVMNVIDNRARDPRWRRLSHKGVCLQRWQFSCWEPKGGPDDTGDPDDLSENFEALMKRAQQMLAKTVSDKLFECLAQADRVLTGDGRDEIGGACHYYADWLAYPPRWARHANARMTAHRHGHIFLAGVP